MTAPEKPEPVCPLDLEWARFLIHNSGDIWSWQPLFQRLMLGDDPDDEDDGGGRPKDPAPRPLGPAH